MLDDLKLINAEFPWFFAVLVSLAGACVGSFLNVCIHRVPKGQSVVRPRSHCACGRPIAWYDNLPVLSWFILRGRARCCGRRFGFRYPFVELLTAGLFLACWLLAPPAVALSWMVFVALMLCATFVDLDTMTIPDRCSVGGMLAGVLLSVFVPQLHDTGSHVTAFVLALQGAFISSALVYWIMVMAEAALGRPAMGEGDVKLMGAIGAFCGWQGGVFALFGGAVLGTLVYFSVMAAQMILGTRKRPPDAALAPAKADASDSDTAIHPSPPVEATDQDDEEPEGAIPFGPALAGGALLYLFYFKPYVTFYFHDLRMLFMW